MVIVGAQFFSTSGGAEARQSRARAALLRLRDVRPINLQFADAPESFAGLETVASLRLDSRAVTGTGGRRKPIVREMLDVLADVAAQDRADWIVYANADIEVTGEAIERIRQTRRDALAFSRLDVDPVTGAPLRVAIYGIDMIAFRVHWWRLERRRFRDYIAGEPFWDNVYAAIACCHGNAEVVNEAPGILHQRHEAAWGGGAFAEYNGLLTALDAPYFSRWAAYAARLEEAMSRDAPIDRERIAAEAFGPPVRWSPRHALRHARARVRLARRGFAAR